jgi:hypothetical protein
LLRKGRFTCADIAFYGNELIRKNIRLRHTAEIRLLLAIVQMNKPNYLKASLKPGFFNWQRVW